LREDEGEAVFTGIIEATGAVKSVVKTGASGRISISAGLDLSSSAPGESMAVNGACLTLTHVSGKVFEADLSDETLSSTTLGSLRSGDRVNLECAMTLSKPLGGHLVTGHVDSVGEVSSRRSSGGCIEFEFRVPARLMGAMVLKGSVAVDGVSLTVAGLLPDGFKVAVIPHTLEKTTLSALAPGSRVNVETDVIGKYVERWFEGREECGITEDMLAEHGFLIKGRTRTRG